MAAPLFYNKGDQDIYNSGMNFVPQEKYRLGYTAPTVNEQKIAQTFGIPNTNAFTNSGGNSFNQSGNAFGYGSPVSEVNVRTFNPQPNNPGITRAQSQYNLASSNNAMTPMTPERRAEIMSTRNDLIQDNRQNYGAQGQYTSPYDDTVDLGYLGRDTSTSLEGTVSKDAQGNYITRKKSGLGKAIDTITDFIPGIGTIKRGAKFIKGMLPDNPNGPGGGSYGVAGLSDAQKEQYNALANQGMLFSGSSGMKTSTGKNFTGKGYEQGQLDIYDKEFADLTDDEKAELADIKNKAFKAKKFRESVVINNFRQDKKDKIAAASAENRGEANAITNRLANEYKAQQQSDGRDFSVSGPDTSSNPTGKSNQASSERGYAMHRADGGRVGYFFGGRVNFKNGGLASIL
jgi:hypothetical protein